VPEEIAPLQTDRFFAPPSPGVAGGSEDPAWLADRDPARPLVYATLGTVFSGARPVFEALVAAADGQCFDLLLTVGRNVDPSTFAAADNVRVERYGSSAARLLSSATAGWAR
jgi:UDP:flavonoid glycosyltransferase YjiC (YdhE family)